MDSGLGLGKGFHKSAECRVIGETFVDVFQAQKRKFWQKYEANLARTKVRPQIAEMKTRAITIRAAIRTQVQEL